MEKNISYAPGHINRNAGDPDVPSCDKLEIFGGQHFFPPTTINAAVSYDEHGLGRIIIYLNGMLPIQNVYLPCSPVTAREIANALCNMADEVEEAAKFAAAAALKKAAGK